MKRQKVFSKILVCGQVASLYGRHGYTGTVKFSGEPTVEKIATEAKKIDIHRDGGFTELSFVKAQ